MKIPNFIKKMALYNLLRNIRHNHIKKYGSRKNKKQHSNLVKVSKFSKKYGVDFDSILTPTELGFAKEDGYSYEPSYDMHNVISFLNIDSKDTIIDLGCGKGWAMYQFSSLPFARIDGVDLSKTLIDIAESNIKKLFNNDPRFHFYHCDVRDFDRLDEYNYVYMFNPFPGRVFVTVLDNLIESLQRKPRKFTIIYQNPQFAKVIEEKELFKCVLSADNTNIYINSDKLPDC